MLLNFDEFIEREFGPQWCIRQCLSFALQMYPTSENLAQAVERNRTAQKAADFIRSYRSSLDPGVFANGKYAFKAFLIQVANHPGQDALPIQFVNYDKLTEEEKGEVSKFGALVKYKNPTVANADTIRAGEVCNLVQKALGGEKVLTDGKKANKFNPEWHIRCWKHFKVRPASRSAEPSGPMRCIASTISDTMTTAIRKHG